MIVIVLNYRGQSILAATLVGVKTFITNINISSTALVHLELRAENAYDANFNILLKQLRTDPNRERGRE
jgi:hypothetical protein